MTDRYAAVVAAVVGLLGGVGGAAVGGYVANEGQEERFEQERAAQVRDLQLDTYVRFLRAAETEHNEGPGTEDPIVRAAAAEVSLVTPDEAIRTAADRLMTNALEFTSESDYRRLRAQFIRLAQAQIDRP